jgi:hypothetical protein
VIPRCQWRLGKRPRRAGQCRHSAGPCR